MKTPFITALAITLCVFSPVSASLSAQDSLCAPQWTVQFTAISGGDTTHLALVMDTASTSDFDLGLDSLCLADTSEAFACFATDNEPLVIQHLPSNGDSIIAFQLQVNTDSMDMTLAVDLGDFLLDSAALWWADANGEVVWDLMADTAFVLPDSTGTLTLNGYVDPSCDILGCTNDEACNYDPSATLDDGSCTYPFFCFDCDGNCLCDEDEDGVCDPFEFPGCTDTEACNYAPVYTEEDGSCFYAQPGFDCAGFCLPVVNDECSLAEPIGCSQVVTASTVCADTTETDFCDQYNIGEYFHGGLWYTIMGTGDTLRATMCFEDTGYDTYLSVFEGDCGNLDCVVGNDDQDEANFFAEPCFDNFLASSVDWESAEGVEYFLHVSGSNAVTPAVGGFDFVLVCDGVEVGACLDSLACNFNPFASFDDGSCDYVTCAGCGLSSACNFDSTAFINDLTLCDFNCYGCTDEGACNFNEFATIESGLCEYSSCAGCLDPMACNYDPEAILDDNNCEYSSCVGCTDSAASNYNPGATEEDGSCTYCDLVLSQPQVTHESCFEFGDGLAVVQLDSALTDSVFYELTAAGVEEMGGWTDGTFSGLLPGDYLLEVLDGDSTCSAVQLFTVNAAPDPALFLVASNPNCAGGEDGSISAFVAGTVMASSYLLNGETADFGGNFLGLAAGDYFVEVNVLVGGGGTCSDTASISVVDPEGMTLTIDGLEGANPGEENGGVSVSVVGGAEPYEFNWSGPSGNSGLEDPDDLAAGDWTLEVTDFDGCTASITATVPVGLPNLKLEGFALAPNPTKDQIQLRFGSLFKGKLLLLDAMGRLADQMDVTGVEAKWSLANQPAGMYTVRAVSQEGRSGFIRLLIED